MKLLLTVTLLCLLVLSILVYKAVSDSAHAQTMSALTSNNITKYTDPYGSFLINYPSSWTAHLVANPFQQGGVLFTNMVPLLSFSIVIGSTALAQTDPAGVLNAYKIFPSTVPAGYSVSQNVECKKYKIDGHRACSIILIGNSSGKVPSEFVQVASHVNNKMFVFTMHAIRNNFGRYVPIFENMLDSFKAPATSMNIIQASNRTMNQTAPNSPPVKTLPMNPMCPPYIRCVS